MTAVPSSSGTTREARRTLLASLALALIVAAFAVGCRRTRVDPDPTPAVTKLKTASPQAVSFPTPDRGLIYANEYGRGDRGVVLVHGGRFNKESWREQAPVLARAGFRVLAIDLRGYGKSEIRGTFYLFGSSAESVGGIWVHQLRRFPQTPSLGFFGLFGAGRLGRFKLIAKTRRSLRTRNEAESAFLTLRSGLRGQIRPTNSAEEAKKLSRLRPRFASGPRFG